MYPFVSGFALLSTRFVRFIHVIVRVTSAHLFMPDWHSIVWVHLQSFKF